MKKFIKDEKAGTAAIVFLIMLILSIVVLVNSISVIEIAYTKWVMTVAYKKGLDKMQQTGGLTADIEAQIKNYTSKFGPDSTKLTVSGTLAEVSWGSDISLALDYDLAYKNYSIVNIVTFNVQTVHTTVHIDGTTSSYYFNNN